jgi:hypothetical protein
MSQPSWKAVPGRAALTCAAPAQSSSCTWEAIVSPLYDGYPFPKLMVTDPQHNWPAALTRIGTAIRP